LEVSISQGQMLRSCREYEFPPWDPFSTRKKQQKQSRTAIKKLDSEPLKKREKK
jgi:hypothetical protein